MTAPAASKSHFARALFALGVMFVVFHGCPRLQAQSQTINGDLGVTGSLDISGGTFNFGAWATDASKPGLGLAYAEDASYASSLTLTMTRPVSGWLWQQAAPGGGTGFVPQMRLSSGNALTLYNQAVPTPVATIVLDPVGTSTFGTSVTFSGTNNQMPSQTITGANSVLTVGLADARYPIRYGGFNGSSLSIGTNATANGLFAMALGNGATANGNGAASIGQYSQASGNNATALGDGSGASGAYAMGMGYCSEASGYGSFAVGLFTSASGDNSQAIGFCTSASGYGSNAVGTGSWAGAEGAVSLGGYSAASNFAAESLGYHSSASGNSAL